MYKDVNLFYKESLPAWMKKWHKLSPEAQEQFAAKSGYGSRELIDRAVRGSVQQGAKGDVVGRKGIEGVIRGEQTPEAARMSKARASHLREIMQKNPLTANEQKRLVLQHRAYTTGKMKDPQVYVSPKKTVHESFAVTPTGSQNAEVALSSRGVNAGDIIQKNPHLEKAIKGDQKLIVVGNKGSADPAEFMNVLRHEKGEIASAELGKRIQEAAAKKGKTIEAPFTNTLRYQGISGHHSALPLIRESELIQRGAAPSYRAMTIKPTSGAYHYEPDMADVIKQFGGVRSPEKINPKTLRKIQERTEDRYRKAKILQDLNKDPYYVKNPGAEKFKIKSDAAFRPGGAANTQPRPADVPYTPPAKKVEPAPPSIATTATPAPTKPMPAEPSISMPPMDQVPYQASPTVI